jgi:uncharacterized protein (DUF342 family)
MENTDFSDVVEITAPTLEEALKNGAKALNTSIINLDYEVIQRGKKGFLGIGKQDFIIRVWKTGELDLSQLGKEEFEREPEELEINVPRDAEAKIKIKKAGIFLKINPPKNGGKDIEQKEVENLLYRRGVHHFNRNKIKKIIKESAGEWIKIGEWIPNPEYDSKLTVTVSPDEMEATVTMSAPIYSGRTLEPEEIINGLEAEGVKYGILYDKIKEMCDEEIVNLPVVVAKGTKPKNGDDAKILYKFRTGLEGGPTLQASEDERVDFRNLNRVQNVIAGQILAEKTAPTGGRPGRTVTNKFLEARDGRDIPLRSGKNTRLSDDKLKIYAQKDGQVFISAGDITVREVYEVRGDVDFNIGNIDFVGTVLIHGNVRENFRIKAAGEVHIRGVSQKAEIIAEGKVICKGGIKGGKIKTGQSLYARYIDNAEVKAGVDVVAREEIINTNVSAGGRVICLTGKGGIIGGKIIAGHEIAAKRLGSEGYIKTHLESGIDPNIKNKLDQLEEKKKILEEKFNKLLTSIDSLETEKDTKAELSEKKENLLKKMHAAREEYSKKLSLIENEIRKLSNYLMGLENQGSISSRYVTYPGVTLYIRNAEYEVKQDYKAVTFKYSGGMIKPNKYEPLEMEKELRRR